MFTGQAEEAMRFYVSTFPDAEILHLDLYEPDDPGREGTVKGATFRIADQTLRCIDSPDVHAFGFTPATKGEPLVVFAPGRPPTLRDARQ
jgi:predicted 3-demethylubiquinone-9 3-methyltransferase (glyoxalase superfamily)